MGECESMLVVEQPRYHDYSLVMCSAKAAQQFALATLGVLGAGGCWDFEARCAPGAECPDGSSCGLSSERCGQGSAPPAVDGVPSAVGCGSAGEPCCDDVEPCRRGLSCDAATSSCVRCGSFEALPALPGRRSAAVLALSRDGSLAVGWSEGDGSEPAAVRWPAGSGDVVALGRLLQDADLLSSRAVATSGDGSIQVGWGTAFLGLTERALRWGTQLTTMADGRALGVSDDGTVIVGALAGTAYGFRWAQDSGLELLMPGRAGMYLNVRAVSGDGNVVVGDAENESREQGAFRWTRGGGTAGLGALDGGRRSFASSTSFDGSIVVGASEGAEGWQVFRWTTREPTLQAVVPYTEGDVLPLTDRTGARIVGATNGAAFVWDAETGSVRRLEETLAAWIPAGWVLQSATGISDDGAVFVGNGTEPGGSARAWRATVGVACRGDGH